MRIATSQVTLNSSTTAILLAHERPGRNYLRFLFGAGSQSVLIGDASVTPSTGFIIEPQDSALNEFLNFDGAVYGILGGAGSVTIQILELY